MKRKNLSYHIRQVHGPKSFHCPICTKSFPLKKKLMRHLNIHSNIRKQRKLKENNLSNNTLRKRMKNKAITLQQEIKEGSLDGRRILLQELFKNQTMVKFTEEDVIELCRDSQVFHYALCCLHIKQPILFSLIDR